MCQGGDEKQLLAEESVVFVCGSAHDSSIYASHTNTKLTFTDERWQTIIGRLAIHSGA